LMGPVAANEWQWYNYDKGITYNGKKYNWTEYFIMRLAEIQKTKQVKLLDVFDVHFYPGTKNIDEITQLHKVFFDKNYIFPEANGIKNISGNWDNTQNKEYYFVRVNTWLDQYFGKNHGITLGMTETGINGENASATAVWYANMMGTFMKNNVEIFTPWSWKTGMWETLHLFTKYNKSIAIAGISSNEEEVSVYPTINTTNDTLTVVLVNRSQTKTQNTTLSFDNFLISSKTFQMQSLKSLPNTETFVSDQVNGISSTNQNVINNLASVSLAPLSVNSLQLVGKEGQFQTILAQEENDKKIKIYPNPIIESFTVEWDNDYDLIEIFDEIGKKYFSQILNKNQKKLKMKAPESKGIYFIKLSGNELPTIKKLVKI
jgi:Glycoside hydrolase family 44/Secretion system C-terminal sorting domain